MLEKRKEVAGAFEMLDMGCTGVRDQRKWVLFRELTNQGDPFRKGIKDIAEGLLKLLTSFGKLEIACQEGEVLVARMATSFVVVSAFM